MRGLQALEYFLENWDSKIRHNEKRDEFDALIEYVFGNEKKTFNTCVCIDKYYDRKVYIDIEEEINEFLPEELEFDIFSGNLYIKRNLFNIKIAPRIC